MIAIYTTAVAAQAQATDIQNYLTANRSGYNAERWQEENKADNSEQWAVYLPADYPTPTNTTLIEALPLNWKYPIEPPTA